MLDVVKQMMSLELILGINHKAFLFFYITELLVAVLST